MLGSLFGSFTDALGKRFLLTTWLPSLLLAGAILAEVAVAAGTSRVTRWVQSFPGIVQAAGVAAFLVVVTLLAVLISVNVTGLLRFCEGYWGTGWLHRHVGCRRRLHYRQVIETLNGTDPGYEQIYQRFPPFDLRDTALPTRVGNILLSSEIYPQVRYGIDAVLVWPRLYQVVPDSVRDTLAAARASMDQLVSLMACGLMFAGAGTVTALILLPWYAAPLCFAAGLALAILAYQNLVSACVPYAETVKAAFDVYRQGLLTAIGWHPARASPPNATNGPRSVLSGTASARTIPRRWATRRSRQASRRRPPVPARLGWVSPRPPAPEPSRWPICGASSARRQERSRSSREWSARPASASSSRRLSPGATVVVAASRRQAFSTVRAGRCHVAHPGWSPFRSGLATTPQQVTGHVLLSEIPGRAGGASRQLGPFLPPGTVAVGATVSPAGSLGTSIGPATS